MGFVPAMHREPAAEGDVDYRLARMAVINDYRSGRLDTADVCDAHPELRRAAAEYSVPTRDDCPICEDTTLALVSYVFGPRLPAHGRCVNSLTELDRIRKRKGAFTCYVVEVCPGCAWNHLRRAYVL
ncbi:MAG: DUF5318 family protein [Acidimicrobiales bacterium]